MVNPPRVKEVSEVSSGVLITKDNGDMLDIALGKHSKTLSVNRHRNSVNTEFGMCGDTVPD
jgi:hypothetical protein